MILRISGLIFGLGLFFSTHALALTERIGEDLSQKNFDGQTIRDTRFIDCKFHYTSFQKARLENVTFIKSQLVDTNFRGSYLKDVTFEQSGLGGSNFQSSFIQGLTIRASWAPKLSFWKAQMVNILFKNSSMLALDLSQSTISKMDITDSYLEDSFIVPSSQKQMVLNQNFADTATLAQELNSGLKKAADFKLLNDVVVTRAPEISADCLKRYPLNKNRTNGPKMLTNGTVHGGCFNACLKKQVFGLELNPQNWPENLRHSLWLEVVTDLAAEKFSSNVKFEKQEKSLFFRVDPAILKLNLEIEAPEEFGIYEIRMVLRGGK